MKSNYRILDKNGLIRFTGTTIGSWFTLEKAKELVNRKQGETIVEYNKEGEKLWEIL